MPNKQFAERLNKELDTIGVPSRSEERVDAFAKLIRIPRFKAEAYLNGLVLDQKILGQIAQELEISEEWLLGKVEQKKVKE